MITNRTIAGGVVVAGLVVLATVSAATAATTDQRGHADLGDEYDAPAFIVDVHENGSATVVVTYTFNLSDATRQDAFEEIRDNATEREQFRARFASQFRSVANASATATGREMAVTNVSLDFRSSASTGVVEAELTWDGLAAVDGRSLTVTEPFASGFSTTRPVHIQAPDGYSVETAGPTPDSTSDGTVTYSAGTDFSGFEMVATAPATPTATATATPTPADGGDGGTATATPTNGTATSTDGDDGGDSGGEGTETPGESGPGFGLLAGLGALLSVALLARRR